MHVQCMGNACARLLQHRRAVSRQVDGSGAVGSRQPARVGQVWAQRRAWLGLGVRGRVRARVMIRVRIRVGVGVGVRSERRAASGRAMLFLGSACVAVTHLVGSE